MTMSRKKGRSKRKAKMGRPPGSGRGKYAGRKASYPAPVRLKWREDYYKYKKDLSPSEAHKKAVSRAKPKRRKK